jgi:dUTP pyrophosphatase
MNSLTYFKIYPEAVAPLYATEGSACFDLSACLCEDNIVIGYTEYNEGLYARVANQKITIYPGERLLVPTGLILGIPENYSVRIHPRSGLSYKKGIALANCEGVIDSDYCEQLFVLLTNISKSPFIVTHGDRIAQGELQKVIVASITETNVAPSPTTSRSGGFGSTGLEKKDNQ